MHCYSKRLWLIAPFFLMAFYCYGQEKKLEELKNVKQDLITKPTFSFEGKMNFKSQYIDNQHYNSGRALYLSNMKANFNVSAFGLPVKVGSSIFFTGDTYSKDLSHYYFEFDTRKFKDELKEKLSAKMIDNLDVEDITQDAKLKMTDKLLNQKETLKDQLSGQEYYQQVGNLKKSIEDLEADTLLSLENTDKLKNQKQQLQKLEKVKEDYNSAISQLDTLGNEVDKLNDLKQKSIDDVKSMSLEELMQKSGYADSLSGKQKFLEGIEELSLFKFIDDRGELVGNQISVNGAKVEYSFGKLFVSSVAGVLSQRTISPFSILNNGKKDKPKTKVWGFSLGAKNDKQEYIKVASTTFKAKSADSLSVRDNLLFSIESEKEVFNGKLKLNWASSIVNNNKPVIYAPLEQEQSIRNKPAYAYSIEYLGQVEEEKFEINYQANFKAIDYGFYSMGNPIFNNANRRDYSLTINPVLFNGRLNVNLNYNDSKLSYSNSDELFTTRNANVLANIKATKRVSYTLGYNLVKGGSIVNEKPEQEYKYALNNYSIGQNLLASTDKIQFVWDVFIGYSKYSLDNIQSLKSETYSGSNSLTVMNKKGIQATLNYAYQKVDNGIEPVVSHSPSATLSIPFKEKVLLTSTFGYTVNKSYGDIPSIGASIDYNISKSIALRAKYSQKWKEGFNSKWNSISTMATLGVSYQFSQNKKSKVNDK